MSVEDPWASFRRVLERPLDMASSWKQSTGGKVVGHLLPDVPEEMIHATGALPLAVEGAGVTVSLAQSRIPGFTCGHAMGALEMAFRGDLAMLDAMVIPYVCDTTRNLFHIWSNQFPAIRSEFLRLPKRVGFRAAKDYLVSEFGRLGDALGAVTGSAPTPEKLADSVALYNRSREHLRRAYERHRTHASLWTAERLGLLTASALRAPREDHLKWMETLPWDAAPAEDEDTRIPIYVRGKLWDPPGILSLFDHLGLTIVQDEIVTGYRSIAEDAVLNGAPMDALVERHLATVAYPGYHVEPRTTADRLVESVKRSQAQGVIFLNPKFCEAAGFDTPDLQQALRENDIPSLILETATRGISTSQIQVRMEAFREMLSDDLP